MGLDMHLYAEKFLGQSMDKTNSYDQIKKIAGMDNLPTSEFANVVVKSMVGYWRKANAIHGWIITHCADGEDNCRSIELNKDQLENLRKDCLVGLANPDRKFQIQSDRVIYQLCDYLNGLSEPITKSNYINPIEPTEGFFFGSNELDDYYYNQLEYTVDLITDLLETATPEIWFSYQASW